MNQVGDMSVGVGGRGVQARRVGGYHARGEREIKGGEKKMKERRRGSLKSSNDLLIDEGPKL